MNQRLNLTFIIYIAENPIPVKLVESLANPENNLIGIDGVHELGKIFDDWIITSNEVMNVLMEQVIRKTKVHNQKPDLIFIEHALDKFDFSENIQNWHQCEAITFAPVFPEASRIKNVGG